ncbi:Sodium-dependent phosphate transporter [Bacillus thermotolerans]|nr:Sodium-dependent phosphate transporter [Bacillus thermotolerans]
MLSNNPSSIKVSTRNTFEKVRSFVFLYIYYNRRFNLYYFYKKQQSLRKQPLIKLSGTSLSSVELDRHNMLADAVRDIERIGDHAENIIELVDYQQANKVKITDQAMADLEEMFALTTSSVNEAIKALDTNDLDLAREVTKKEDLIDKMERKLRKQHILRMNEGVCSGQAGIVFVDIVSNLERMGDHAVNIAEAILGIRDAE